MSHTIQPKILGAHRYQFSVNGESFGDLLARARCKDLGRFSGLVIPNQPPARYPYERYEIRRISRETRDIRAVIEMLGSQSAGGPYATIRELVGFIRAFPGILRKRRRNGQRLVALGRDVICPHGGAIPFIYATGNHFVLDGEKNWLSASRPWTTEDCFLVRSESPRVEPLVA